MYHEKSIAINNKLEITYESLKLLKLLFFFLKKRKQLDFSLTFLQPYLPPLFNYILLMYILYFYTNIIYC